MNDEYKNNDEHLDESPEDQRIGALLREVLLDESDDALPPGFAKRLTVLADEQAQTSALADLWQRFWARPVLSACIAAATVLLVVGVPWMLSQRQLTPSPMAAVESFCDVEAVEAGALEPVVTHAENVTVIWIDSGIGSTDSAGSL